MIEKLLKNKKGKEKATLKADEIVKINHAGVFNRAKLKIEIIELTKIDGGVQVFAKAWKGKKQLGFSKDGSVAIERFKIFNPPVLVDDENGNIVKKWKDKTTGEEKTRKLKYDPKEAILQSLEHTIGVIGKEDTNIVKGKVGNTTSTFYPDAGTGSTTVDGEVARSLGTISGEAWATLRAGAGTISDSTGATDSAYQWTEASTAANEWEILKRSIYTFDTSTLPDGDTIDSATFSLYGSSKADANSDAPDMNVFASTPASDNALVNADYGQTGSTAFATAITYANQSTIAYNDFTLNASGLAAIDAEGITKLSVKNENFDNDNTAPANHDQSRSTTRLIVFFADETGTTKDPKLVVEHTGLAADNAIIMGTNF